MFSDLLLFGLPTVMAYTGWGSVKFDYSTLSCSFAPLPCLYCLFTMENSMEASGMCRSCRAARRVPSETYAL
jgi:hypothetical protein